MVDGGKLQLFGLYSTRIEGEGPVLDDLRRAGELCNKNAPSEAPDRDTSHDLNLFPPSPEVLHLSASVLAGAEIVEG